MIEGEESEVSGFDPKQHDKLPDALEDTERDSTMKAEPSRGPLTPCLVAAKKETPQAKSAELQTAALALGPKRPTAPRRSTTPVPSLGCALGDFLLDTLSRQQNGGPQLHT